jgi:hypothetical protein
MIIDYFQWQFVLAPNWLLKLLWTIERASIRFFSIKIMLRTLIAHWHKDSMAWKGGTITGYITTQMWNVISRVIGFIVRATVILTWVATQIIFIPLSVVLFLLFVTWPLLVVVGVSTGFALFLF